ncbi:ATP-binding protein [Natrialbaceae archaeon A-arb3/5]
MSTENRSPFPHRLRSPLLVSAFGILSFVAFVGWRLAFLSTMDVASLALGFATVGVPSLGLAWGGYRVSRSEIEPRRYGRIVAWCLGGSVAFLAVNVPSMVLFPWYGLEGTVAWIHFSLTSGAVGGFTVGYVEARAIQREVETTSAAVRTDQLADEREVLMYLNDLLRHEVLNSVQIINGHATLLLEESVDDEMCTHLETISRESEALETVIDDVRVVIDANAVPEQSSVIDLTDVLAAVVDDVQAAHDAEIDVTAPESAFVPGNRGLERLFSNLFENAIVHNDSKTPSVDATIERTDRTVTVTIADDGPGIPDEQRETLFERKSKHHGLGLYLARILANRYGGSIDLVETGSDGSTFAVTLPRAATDSNDEPNHSDRSEPGADATETVDRSA